MQVAVVRFINPPSTLPMLIDQGNAMFSRTPKSPLRYRWIALPQIPEMIICGEGSLVKTFLRAGQPPSGEEVL